jgi:hypothetical protein
MAPRQYDFHGFIRSVTGKDQLEVIELADREATKSQRCCLRIGSSGSETGQCAATYAQKLQGLIFYLRYRAKPPELDLREFHLLQRLTNPRPFH